MSFNIDQELQYVFILLKTFNENLNKFDDFLLRIRKRMKIKDLQTIKDENYKKYLEKAMDSHNNKYQDGEDDVAGVLRENLDLTEDAQNDSISDSNKGSRGN